MFNFLKGRKRIIKDRDSNEPYLIRWYLFLKDRKNFPFNITLHKVLKSDEPVLHNHPWSYATLILKGGYWEHTPCISREGATFSILPPVLALPPTRPDHAVCPSEL